MDELRIRQNLLAWYRLNKRDLPWRETNNPYFIWISEVILQQTRIIQGVSYYNKFINKFPTVATLALASEEDVLKIWQGLGYYSRARNIHNAAKYVHFELSGIFPSGFLNLKKLKGVGDYTAAAIASIAYNEAVPSVDGNVYRVLSRLLASNETMNNASGKKHYFDYASHLMDKEHPGDFNQALMELGALICIPSSPLCNSCPLVFSCNAHIDNSIHLFPVKKTKMVSKNRFFHYIVISTDDSIFMKKRTENDIWKNLYDFPLIESDKDLTLKEILSHSYWNALAGSFESTLQDYSKQYIHILTHQKIHARFLYVHMNLFDNFPAHLIKIDKSKIFEVAIPRLIDKYILKTLT